MSATQIQPRPLVISKKNALNADMVRNAPPSAISAEPATTVPMRIATTFSPCASTAAGILADRADREAERRAVEQEGDDAEQREGEERQRRLLEQRRADERQVREARNVQRPERHDGRRRRDVRQREAVDEVGEAGREQRDADAGDVLRQAERHGEQREQKPDDRAGQRRDQHAGPQVRAEIDAHPARHRAGGEDALDAEVEHARALAQQRAEHAEHVGRRDADRGGPEARGEQDVEHAVHRHRSRMWKRTNRPLTSTHRSASATIRSAM